MAADRWISRVCPKAFSPGKQSAAAAAAAAAAAVEPQSAGAVRWQQHADADAPTFWHAGGTTNATDRTTAAIHAQPTDGAAAIRGIHDAGIPNRVHGRTAFLLTVRGGFFV